MLNKTVHEAALVVIAGSRTCAVSGKIDPTALREVARVVTGLDHDALIVLVGFLGGIAAGFLESADDPEEMMDRIRYGEVG